MANYVIFGAEETYYKVGYSDILSNSNVRYIQNFIHEESSFVNKLFLLHHSSKLNHFFSMPFKSMWFRSHFVNDFEQLDQMVFIFFHRWSRIFDSGYIQYLRKRYKNCKCILFLQDINAAKKLDIKKEKDQFDLIMVFDKDFAKQNGIDYYPLVYSEGLKEEPYPERDIDLLFVGKDKGRKDFLYALAQRLSSNNINFQFYISDTDTTNKGNDHIHYFKHVDYFTNIRLIKRSKCILDVVPPNTNCNTLRSDEAIAYRTRILTNNSHIKEESYFNEQYVSIYTDADNIDIPFLKQPYSTIDYHYLDKLSAKELLIHINNLLNIQS